MKKPMKTNKALSDYTVQSQRIIDGYTDDIKLYVRVLALDIESRTRSGGITLNEIDELVEKQMEKIIGVIERRDSLIRTQDESARLKREELWK